ncbi:MAG: bifunctional methylenetetrahydrofolate dehydrogenase/methenyltetrahydrofolate cyclohydrolase FolD [Saprospiraceae bacterium]|jgi:methylenetetrahydrofolate dehydrogenase (NADP+)/methenyltetrahydrofolate cyclohydrolase|nr:bifunctional methylenetetrahydrofolate dehydrogenase/methenyltetrahydrofolate cyclohydrolase FolD [Chitinophagia bacterium]
MAYKLLDGKALASTLKSEIKLEVDRIIDSGKRVPHLSAVLVGNNPASEAYMRNKVRSCEELGFSSDLIRKESTISQEELIDTVKALNEDDNVDGFIVQLPLPDHIDETEVLLAIDPRKDVDGFHPFNFGCMAQGLDGFLPATPYGIMLMLERNNVETSGKNVIVIGRSNIVGTPMSLLLSRKSSPGNATVTLAHSRTKNLKEICLNADIIISALGKPFFVTADMVTEGVVIIDVGINRIDDLSRKRGYRLVGDVDFERVAPKSSYITPVPGGVGPMTVAALMLNTLKAYHKYQD